jgi:hypothetical protein
MVVVVAPVTIGKPDRLRQQTNLLVIANGLNRALAARSKLAYAHFYLTL